MPATVKLSAIVDALEMLSDEISQFFDPETGEIYAMPNDVLREVEDEDAEPPEIEWQRKEWEAAKLVLSSDHFLPLPDKFDVHEWEILREFTENVESEEIRNELRGAIHGRGAFRMFKDAVRRHGIEEKWYQFRTEALTQIAREWCEGNGIPYE